MLKAYRTRYFRAYVLSWVAATELACGGNRGASIDGPAAPSTRCQPSPGATGAPNSIEEAVILINSLPKPTSIPCFLESLDRPLRLSATQAIISAQPAKGRRSPRIFLFTNGLIISVVPEGVGTNVVEFGELQPEDRSIKGELEFPIHTPVPWEGPFTQVMFDEGRTNCAFCHASEVAARQVGTATAYASAALRPNAGDDVPLSELREQAENCDLLRESERCAMLQTLFRGAIEKATFPATFRLLGE
jgi:hypothetical protein